MRSWSVQISGTYGNIDAAFERTRAQLSEVVGNLDANANTQVHIGVNVTIIPDSDIAPGQPVAMNY